MRDFKEYIGLTVEIQENVFVKINYIEERIIEGYDFIDDIDSYSIPNSKALFISESGSGWYKLYPHDLKIINEKLNHRTCP